MLVLNVTNLLKNDENDNIYRIHGLPAVKSHENNALRAERGEWIKNNMQKPKLFAAHLSGVFRTFD